MIHLGDITKLNGAEIPVVDCITGGSPCQDLSVAGKRAGLKGERSGLFMEQVRIVREMRERDRARGRTGYMVRPRYMVWENVPGAFSSAKGEDFAAVVEEILKVCEPGASVSVRVPDRGWPKSGCYYAEDGTWSVAWRVHDAQFWGVPQRRKRIALVADFGGLSAPEVLFERKGLRWHPDESEPAGKEAAAYAERGIGADDREGNSSNQCCGAYQNTGIGWWNESNIGATLRTPCGGDSVLANVVVQRLMIESAGFKAGQSKAGGLGYQEECAATLSAQASGVEPTVCDARGNGNGATSPTPTGDHQNRVTDYTAVVAHSIKAKGNLDFREDSDNLVTKNMMVRRLTPLECERLQGYPDGWTDIGEWTDSKGKKRQTTDTARYKALGNSIALPFWFWLLRRISAQYERPATLGSLFDGIGGFPLCWERCNGKGTAIWASEIEEFPIAVTKRRFGDD